MDEYTVAMTVVLTAQDMGEVSEVSEKVREHLRLLIGDRDGRVEWNNMQVSRRGATIDDVVPAKIVTAADILRQKDVEWINNPHMKLADEEVTP
jgi:hypothetical protein